MKYQHLILGTLVLSISLLPVSYAAESDAQLGMPPPGMAGDQENTKKQRNPAKDHRADQNAQVTLGGAKSTVTGEIKKVQGDYFFVKDDDSGDEVRLLVNQDTNMDCGGAMSQMRQEGASGKGAAAEQQMAGSSGRQREQGQRPDETAIGSGFKVGACSFNSGDKVRAEVDDNGRVTTLKFLTASRMKDPETARSLGESAGTGELAIPGRQDKPGQLDMTGKHGYPPKEYAILPVPMGEFKVAGRHSLLNSPVKSPDGDTIGKIESLIIDGETGRIEYAVVSTPDAANALQAVPWPLFSINRDGQNNNLVLNTKQYQLTPDVTQKEAANRSPEIEKLLKDRKAAIAPGDLRDEEQQKSASAEGQRGGTDRRMEAMRDVQGDIIRGRVMQVLGENLLVKEKSGKEINIHMDRRTKKGEVNLKDEPFKEGDRIEAYVMPDGHAFSITLMRAQGGIPGDPDAGG